MLDDEGLPNVDNAHIISFDQLQFEEEIGSGSFGSVYKGSYLGTPVAIKKIAKSEDLKQELDIFVQREQAMTKYSHPHLVQFIGVSSHDVYLYLVTEYVPGGDLRRYLKNPLTEIPWKLRVQIALDVARAMAFLHSKKIMHRDLKSKNLLVDANWKIKVCDFGFARSFQPQKRPYTLCGTEDWMAPEIIMGMDYDEKVDIFSYGIVLCEIITRKKIADELQRVPEEAFCLNVAQFEKLVPLDCPQVLKDLAILCSDFEPEKRPSFIEILDVLTALEREIREGKPVTTVGGRAATPPPQQQKEEKPEFLAPSVPEKRRTTTTVEKTHQALAPKTKFTVLRKRSLSARRLELQQVHSVSKLATLAFDNPDAFYTAIENFHSPDFKSGWICLGYKNDKTLVYQAMGNTADELAKQLADNQVQYSLIRVVIEEGMKKTTTYRDVFIMWTGPSVGAVQAGRKKSHVGEVKKIVEPFHAELTAVSRESFTLENIIAKSDPLSGSHVID
jgi:serine/threonine protein kinase